MNNFQVNAAAASLRIQAVEQLRRAILTGHFPPGAHLPDRELCDLLAVSRAVVREAVRQLESEDLVVTVPRRGSFVNVLSIEEARQIYDIRALLEALAARNFARDASDLQIKQLQGDLAEIKAWRNKPPEGDFLDLKSRFYATMLSVPSNDYARKMLGQIHNRTIQLRATSALAPQRMPQSSLELTRIVKAIRRRDEQEAWQASIDHVNNAAEAAIRILSEANAKAGYQFRRGRANPRNLAVVS